MACRWAIRLRLSTPATLDLRQTAVAESGVATAALACRWAIRLRLSTLATLDLRQTAVAGTGDATAALVCRWAIRLRQSTVATHECATNQRMAPCADSLIVDLIESETAILRVHTEGFLVGLSFVLAITEEFLTGNPPREFSKFMPKTETFVLADHPTTVLWIVTQDLLVGLAVVLAGVEDGLTANPPREF
eukprot:CAMPEP_0203909192 /NCGR_PEP_ID=MMETSP0359-20131031/50525_1 /ASSEMBLY_ACC=CAM_ASM_000338 /TAXON_ID=268821 /ORGANISM="Scrippsiella Hangoei, Strain SHTV-5" /LENGTH=190 /DNA_ID=CAMNT_0050834379 /DNA_START=354 /DNA_END=930 /DNA_ORIENTATION=-